jgi:hypothetical protein
VTPTIPAPVRAAFDAIPATPRTTLLDARAAILAAAEETGTGPLTETLKWGEPAYLTETTRAGSTVRLGLVKGEAAALFHCQTTLVDSFRADFPALRCDGNRAVLLDGADAQDLALCFQRALTYHRDKRRRA